MKCRWWGVRRESARDPQWSTSIAVELAGAEPCCPQASGGVRPATPKCPDSGHLGGERAVLTTGRESPRDISSAADHNPLVFTARWVQLPCTSPKLTPPGSCPGGLSQRSSHWCPSPGHLDLRSCRRPGGRHSCARLGSWAAPVQRLRSAGDSTRGSDSGRPVRSTRFTTWQRVDLRSPMEEQTPWPAQSTSTPPRQVRRALCALAQLTEAVFPTTHRLTLLAAAKDG
jgi:hypothetical protein